MITSIDHIVLTSKDVDKTIEFYTKILGMTLELFPVANEQNKMFDAKAKIKILRDKISTLS